MTTDTFSPNSRSELIKRLGSSTFNYWFGYVANVALVIWIVSHAFRPHATLLGPREFLGFALAGLFSWTLGTTCSERTSPVVPTLAIRTIRAIEAIAARSPASALRRYGVTD